MSNGQLHDDKLFQGLHDRLSDYEAPYDGADWDAMSRSLDKLPKTNNFRWKFSLNTIGIMLGIVGLTAVGVVIAAGNDKPGAPAENKSVTVTAPEPPAANTTQAKPVQPASPDVTPNVSLPTDNSFLGMNSHHDLNNPKREESKEEIPFRLGDQIDPAKGFVKETQEDPALMKNHSDMKQPDVYYDIDDNGKIKPIKIDHDTANGLKEIKQDSIPQAPANVPEPAAPTEGQRIGFDQP
jgi:hypothetical protein